MAIPGIKCKIFINNSFTSFIFQTPQISYTVFLDNISARIIEDTAMFAEGSTNVAGPTVIKKSK